jgi:hypothetical protein
MKRSLAPLAIILVATLFCTVSARSQEVTQADKEKTLQYLESTKKDVLDATKGLSSAQWNFKPAPDRWSIAECMEHIAAAEDYIRGNHKWRYESPGGPRTRRRRHRRCHY